MANTKKKATNRTLRLVISALLIALGTALSIVKLQMPFGGSVTPGAMVPLVIISLMYGLGWGSLCCVVYGALQLVLGLSNFSYVTTLGAIIAVVLFDYIVAYGVMSLSALAKGIKKPAVRAVVGSVIGCVLRFLCHFITGVYVWGQWADAAALPSYVQDTALATGKALVYSYSFFYNLSYMLPETIITAVVSAVVIGIVYKLMPENRLNKKQEKLEEVAPAAEEAAPVVEEAAPAVEEAAPTVEEAAAEAVEEAAPSVEEAAAEAVEEAAPAAEEAAAEAVEEAAPAAEEAAAEAVEDAAPAAEEAAAEAVEEAAPAVEEAVAEAAEKAADSAE